MTTEQVAIIISVISAIVASFSLGWNIYRDVVLKAKVRVTATIVFILHETLPDKPRFVSIQVTNFGPGAVNISTILAKEAPLKRRLQGEAKHAVINHDWTNPMSSKLPAKIEVADKITLFLPFDEECFLKEPFTHVGVSDYFGRIHWVPRKQVRRARQEWLEEFGQAAQRKRIGRA